MTRTRAPRRHLPSSPFNAQREALANAVPTFELGDRVTHDRHGLGTIVRVETGSYVVQFGSETRRISVSLHKMHKI